MNPTRTVIQETPIRTLLPEEEEPEDCSEEPVVDADPLLLPEPPFPSLMIMESGSANKSTYVRIK